MSLLVVGSIAIDSIQTPSGRRRQVLGGSATYAALAARFWTRVEMVGVVGSDFPRAYAKLFDRYRLNGQGIVQVKGKTFRWKGRYNPDGQPTTLFLDLGVFSGFQPKLSPSLKTARHAFLGNIHPTLQWKVLQQLKTPRLVACDSRDDWILTQRHGFLKLLKQKDILFLKDSEARLLTGVHGLVQATRILARLGPKVAIVKKGEHGVLAASGSSFFSMPSFPVAKVVDPTGAGDAFAGACLGYLTTQGRLTWSALCRAIQLASATASMTIEAFGPARLLGASRRKIAQRAQSFWDFSRAVLI